MSADIVKLRNIFKDLESILENEESNRWLADVRTINDILAGQSRGELTPSEALDLVKKKYKSMHPSHGGFNDFFIWRDDFEERKRLNSQLENLANRAWKELDLI